MKEKEKNVESAKKPKKSKWKKALKIIAIVLGTIVVLGALAVFIFYDDVMLYVGNTVTREMAKTHINSEIDSGNMTVEELEIIAGEREAPTEPPADIVKPEGGETVTSDTQAQGSGEETPDNTQTDGADSQKASDGEAAVKTESKPSAPAKTETSRPASEIAPERRNELVNKAADNVASWVSREDKEAMARLITSRLSASDISYLSGLLQGGLTREERSAAYDVAVARFQGDELAQVSSFYHKYKKQIMCEPDYGVEE